MDTFAPVVSIGYSRVNTLMMSLRRLSLCDGVNIRDCYLFLDAPYRAEDIDACNEMYKAAVRIRDSALPNLKIVRRDRNYGVPGNLIAAITETLTRYKKVIFFEDDVLVSRTFLKYMDAALDKYESDKRIFCINGFKSPYLNIPKRYQYDVYLTHRNMAWGFGTWSDQWVNVDFDMKDWGQKKNDLKFVETLMLGGEDLPYMIESQLLGRIKTWDVQCSYHMAKNGLLAVEPKFSLSKNVGFGQNEGVHCHAESMLSHQKYYSFLPTLPKRLEVDPEIERRLAHSTMDTRLIHRFYRKAMRVISALGPIHDEPLEVKR